MSRFHRYSVNNTMLIFQQRPDATLVAGFRKWQNQFGRHVKKGEHGITIIAPTPYKKKIEAQKLDPDTKAPILDENGQAVMEEKEVVIPLFRPVKVFDVAQTDGKPLPELVENLTGDVQQYEIFLEALRRSAPVPISLEPLPSNLDGYFSPKEQRIVIREGMSEVQTISAVIHEIAHSKLHDVTKCEAEEPPKPKGRNTEEVEAESISYAVCQYYGIETSGNSFGYIATWSKDKDLPELRASLETINKTACELIDDIERHYKEICKERGIDLTAEQAPQQATEEKTMMEEAVQPSTENRQFPAAQLPDAQEMALDEYPMPAPELTQNDLAQCGYLDSDLLPLSKERADALLARGLTIYIVQEGKNPEMVFDTADLDTHDGIFAIPREEWEQSSAFHEKVLQRQDRQQEREQAFLSYGGDCFAIYQVRRDDPQNVRFMNLDWLQSNNLAVDRKNYDLIYTAPLHGTGSTMEQLERLYEQFNLHKPVDFHSPSMSVSDIVAIRQNGQVSCYYCDSVGFTEVLGFLPDNPLKNAEMALEDDYNMIDGILNNGAREIPVKEKLSLLERIKRQPKMERKNAAPQKSAEMEI